MTNTWNPQTVAAKVRTGKEELTEKQILVFLPPIIT
jgi:hypothetical protein